MSFLVWLLFLVLSCQTQISAAKNHVVFEQSVENDTPIIGILSQELTKFLESSYPDQFSSFIAASYVKFVESAGARVIPIWIGRNESYYQDVLRHINGVLLPGGASWFENPLGYADAGEHIYKAAVSMNDEGSYFPIWGTCLGFELLTYLAANRTEHRADCHAEDVPMNLNFKNDFTDSKMFAEVPEDVVEILSKQKITANFHKYCTTEANLTKFNLADDWRVMSLNEDENGMSFISSIESKRYPFYGVQFHPEKVMFEWKPKAAIVHSKDSIKANAFFGDFFIAEARKSANKFPNKSEETSKLIYNYQTTYTGLKNSIYQQCYFFK